MKRLPRKPTKPDPYFQDVPQEIIFDDRGRVIGEVFTLPAGMVFEGRSRRNQKSDRRAASTTNKRLPRK